MREGGRGYSRAINLVSQAPSYQDLFDGFSQEALKAAI